MSAKCVPRFCLYEGAPATDGNVSDDPLFRGAGDYHLQATSPAIDAVVASPAGWDIDGQRRPVGADGDVGADEVR